MRTIFKIVLACAMIGILAAAAQSQEKHPKRPDIVAVYYPHWHHYDHANAWKGEGWTEWDELKAAIPRFPGHHQPLEPLWGCFDESDPRWAAKEIDLAADNGIDVFLYDWYWCGGVHTMEEALEKGFLKAPNRGRMKFALMWANHDRIDQFCPEYGKPRTVWLHCHHSEADLNRVIDYGIAHYFREPNYWRVQGRLFFSIYQPMKFVKELGGPEKTREVFARIDERLRRANLPPMHWSAMVAIPGKAAEMKAAGFLSLSSYNVTTGGKIRPDNTEDYEDIIKKHHSLWKSMQSLPLVNIPVVTRGWDSSPRCRTNVAWPWPKNEYPYTHVVTGSTPERFEQLLKDAAQTVNDDPHAPFAVLVNAWNEWTEGSFLLPEKQYGAKHLEAIRKVFGTKAEVK